jgi:ribonuclease P protein component
MPKDIRSTNRITAQERKRLLRYARLIHRQDELDIRSLPRDSNSSPLAGRILIITPRKVGNAPERNLIRRRCKAIFREEKVGIALQDFLIYCRKGSADLTFQDLKEVILASMKRLPTSSLSSK